MHKVTSLVGADGGSSAHGLSGAQVSHQVVVLQHTCHAVGQGNGHCQRQPLRDCHHLQGSQEEMSNRRTLSFRIEVGQFQADRMFEEEASIE